MTTTLLLLAVPLTIPALEDDRSTSRPEIVRIEVDLLETNVVRNDAGRVRFTQVIAWDARTNGSAVDRGYKVVKDGYPRVQRFGETHRVVWWASPDKVIVLTAREHLLTDTRHDREARFREFGGLYRPCW